MERVDCVVIGAGVVGLAVARRLAMAGREVIVLDKEDAIGTETSSRNSEVIHAGTSAKRRPTMASPTSSCGRRSRRRHWSRRCAAPVPCGRPRPASSTATG
jgi:L-2-hydroxyglutarate oxidase LhgO